MEYLTLKKMTNIKKMKNKRIKKIRITKILQVLLTIAISKKKEKLMNFVKYLRNLWKKHLLKTKNYKKL